MTKTNEIKKLFKDGKTVKEIVELGFTKPLAYKVQKQFRKTETVKESEILDIDNSDSLSSGGDNTDTLETLDNSETEIEIETDGDNNELINSSNDEEFNEDEQNRINELFGPGDDEAIPFREYSGIIIDRDNTDIIPIIPEKTSGKASPCTKKSAISTSDALTEGFELISILTGEDFWALSPKEQKLIKKLCILPGIDKYLSKLGVYGCGLILIQILFKRIKLQLNKSKEPSRNEQEPVQTVPIQPGTITRPADKSGHVMEGLIT